MFQTFRVEPLPDGNARPRQLEVNWGPDGPASTSSQVRRADLFRSRHAEALLLHCSAGSTIAMHAGSGYSHTIAITGSGHVGFPDGTTAAYAAPSVVIFEAHAMHSWHADSETELVVVYTDGEHGR